MGTVDDSFIYFFLLKRKDKNNFKRVSKQVSRKATIIHTLSIVVFIEVIQT